MIWFVARSVLVESLRRRVFLVVPIVTVLFLGLYAFAVDRVTASIDGAGGRVDGHVLAGASLLGLSMFATLFLGAVLASFLTFSTVRGDAEQGILQPAIVRPPGRRTWIIGRYLGATVVGVTYAVLLFACCVVITGAISGWWPDRVVEPGWQLAAGIAIIAAISTLGSVFLSATANGTTTLMLFGAGLTTGFMEQIGTALDSDTLVRIGRMGALALPFEALYQAALRALTADVTGVTGFVVRLGPFGGGRGMTAPGYLWVAVFSIVVAVVAVRAFERRDL